jgi:hypothetical protein
MSEGRGTHVPVLESGWVCPRLFEGESVFVLGNGPSLRETRLEGLRARRTVAVNSAALLAPWAQVVFFGDARWWWLNRGWAAGLPGLKVTLSRFWVDADGVRREEPVTDVPGVYVMRQKGMNGLCMAPDALTWNLSSGGSAIDLAVHLGARRVVLVGFDMRCGEDGRRNAVPNANKCSCKWESMNVEGMWRRMAEAAMDRGVEIVNATPGSALRTFPMVDLEGVL